MKRFSEARVAIVFEWFQKFGGVERVVAEMRNTFPDADLFALVHDPESLQGTPLEGAPVTTSFIQSLPKSRQRYRAYLPLMPFAVEQFDLRDYDIVLSSSHSVTKGVLTRADQLHVSYTYTPVRYAWDLYQDYLAENGLQRGPKSWLARIVLHYLRLWDVSASHRVDEYITLSNHVARRIESTYRRSARVIYPPVEVERYRPDLPREDFYVTTSRLVPYKRVDLISETFTRLGKPLIVIGDGPDRAKIERVSGSNVTLLGYQPDEVVANYLQRAKAFVFAANEDFGITPLEAQAAGCPVIAYGRGGALETVIGYPEENATGLFFDFQTPDSLRSAVEEFEAHSGDFATIACRQNAERFSASRFRRELRDTLEKYWSEFQGTGPTHSLYRS